jgi:hypothetical protein
MNALNGWENFYVIVGSSAGALIGLQFVVIALIAGMPAARGDAQSGSTFATPSVVHFGVVLVLSAILAAPWNGIPTVALLWGLMGLCGLAYVVIVALRMRRQTAYRPVFEDWSFHVLLPLVAYALLTISAYATRFIVSETLYLVGAAALMLLLTGIHNAWDAVTYHVFVRRPEHRETASL